MAITTAPYVQFLLDLGNASHDLADDNQKIALLDNAYVPNLATHASFDDVNNYELADDSAPGGYVAGGSALVNKAYTYVLGAATLTADPIAWTALTGTFRYAVIYRVGARVSAPTNGLIGLVDFGTDRTFAAEPCQLNFSNGAIALAGA